MPLRIYRRHNPKKCLLAPEETGCSCPIWVTGDVDGKVHPRESLKTRTWAIAAGKIALWNEEPHKLAEEVKQKEAEKAEEKIPLLGAALEKFYLYCQSERNIKDSTMVQYKLVLRLLVNYKGENTPLKEITTDDVRSIMNQRFVLGHTVRTRHKELVILKIFLNWINDDDLGWITKLPARKVKIVVPKGKVTLPFTDDEIARMVEACDRIGHGCQKLIPRTRARARALILGMCFTGFRISDMASLKRSEVKPDGTSDEHLIVKTQQVHFTQFGEQALRALLAVPFEGEYFFWNGKSKLKSACATLRQTVKRIGEIAGVEGVARPHRFRDTFALKILEETGDIRILQKLLGHANIQTTQNAYEWEGEKQRARLKEALGTIEYRRDGTTGKLIEMPHRG